MQKPIIKIGSRLIGQVQPVFIVAEISANHLQDLDRAKRLIKVASQMGADAIKLQTYTPDTMTIDSKQKHFYASPKNAPDSWKKVSLYELYKTAYTPWEWHGELFKEADSHGLIFFSTPFDDSSVDFLESLNVPCYKISSYELTHIPLLKKVAKTKKPVIASVGFANTEEIREAVETLRSEGSSDVSLLHCVTSYESLSRDKDLNLSRIEALKAHFDVVPGFSDNNGGIDAPILAVYAGAKIIEKHFTLSRRDGGPDERFSLEPLEFKKMVEGIRRAESVLGNATFGASNASEAFYKNSRRSIFASKDIKKGEAFNNDNIKIIRPALGLHPREYDKIILSKSNKYIEKGTPLSWDCVQN